jgi:predicted deacylase
MRGSPLVVPWLLGGCVLSQPMETVAPRLEPHAAEPRRLDPADWHEIGRSLRGRPIVARTLGSGPRKVLWVGAIHGDEREGWVATERLGAAFLARPGLAERVTLHLIRDLNPDGSATGRRSNAVGVDLNRNFPASNFAPGNGRGALPLDQPESALLQARIETIAPDLVIVAHSARHRKFINYDGPAEHLAALFAEHSGYPVVVSESLHGTPGSLGSWVGIDQGIPILTLEYRNGQDPYVAWDETREAILAVIAAQ